MSSDSDIRYQQVRQHRDERLQLIENIIEAHKWAIPSNRVIRRYLREFRHSVSDSQLWKDLDSMGYIKERRKQKTLRQTMKVLKVPIPPDLKPVPVPDMLLLREQIQRRRTNDLSSDTSTGS